jgi:hypothetical protein
MGLVCYGTSRNGQQRQWIAVLVDEKNMAAQSLILFSEPLNNNDSGDSNAVTGMAFTKDDHFEHCLNIRFSAQGRVFCVLGNPGKKWVCERGAEGFFGAVTMGVSRRLTVVIKGGEKEFGLGWGGEVSRTTSLLYRHKKTILSLAYFPHHAIVLGVDEAGAVVCYDEGSQKTSVAYEFSSDIIVSDVQRIVGVDGAALLAVSQMPKVAAASRKGDDGFERMVYENRRVVFLSLNRSKQTGKMVIEQCNRHNPIEWAGIGGCQMIVRSLAGGRIAVASDSKLVLYQFSGDSPFAQQMWVKHLGGGVTANDVVSSLSVFDAYISLSHMYGSVAMFCEAGTEYSLWCKGVVPGRFDGPPPIMLASNVVLTPFKDGIAVMVRVGNELKFSFSIVLHGEVSCSFYDERRRTGYFATTRGEIFAVKLIADEVFRAIPSKAISNFADGKLLKEYFYNMNSSLSASFSKSDLI